MRTHQSRPTVANMTDLRSVSQPSGTDADDPLEAFAGYLLALGLAPRTVTVYERALARFFVFATDEEFDPFEANVFDLSGYGPDAAEHVNV